MLKLVVKKLLKFGAAFGFCALVLSSGVLETAGVISSATAIVPCGDCGYWCAVCAYEGSCEFESCLGWCYQNCY